MAQSQNALISFYKAARWIVLAGLVFFVFIALRRPASPTTPLTPETATIDQHAFDSKVQQLADAHQRGEKTEARFNTDEVNAEIARTLAETVAPQTVPGGAQPSTPALSANSEVGQGLPVQTVEVGFVEDQVVGQFATQVYGKNVFITVAGKLGSRDGYVTFDPSSFKVGDLNVPVSLVNDSLQKKLADPENREKMKLPDFISGVRVESGELVVSEK